MRGFYKDFLTLSLFKTKSQENIDFNPDHPRLFLHIRRCTRHTKQSK